MKMPATLRLSKDEQKLLAKKCIQINKLLIGMEKKPITESELAHIVLESGINQIEVDKEGTIRRG